MKNRESQRKEYKTGFCLSKGLSKECHLEERNRLGLTAGLVEWRAAVLKAPPKMSRGVEGENKREWG